MGKLAGVVGGGGSVAAIVAASGWPGAAVVIGLCVMILVLSAWVLADIGRSSRLAMLIWALRGKK